MSKEAKQLSQRFIGLDPGIFGSIECTVEAAGRTDEREMSQSLRHVSAMFAAATELLRIEPEVVRISQYFFEEQLGFLNLMRASQTLYQPEGTCGKVPFFAFQGIASPRVAEDQAIF